MSTKGGLPCGHTTAKRYSVVNNFVS